MKKWRNAGLAAVLVLAGLFVFYQTHQADGAVEKEQIEEQSALREVKIVKPVLDNSDNAYTFNVRLEPFEEAMIYARANGYVEEWMVDIGSRVEKEQTLAKLSLPELEEQINQVKAEINSQEAEIVLAKTLRDRVASLVDSGAVSKTEVDQRNADYKVAVAKRDALKARIGQLEQEFSYTTIQAPFDGIITLRNLNRGDRITVNDAKPLFRIINADKLRVVIEVPQTQLANISFDQSANLSFADKPGEVYRAEFWRKSDEVNLSSGTMRIEYILDNKEYGLPSGLSARLNIPAATGLAKWLPINTLKADNGKSYIMAIDSNNKVMSVPVAAGRYTGDKVEILSGLTGDEKVIINPNALLKNGDAVKVAK